MNIRQLNDFESRFNEELMTLDREGFFSEDNWEYTAENILSFYNNLSVNLKKECQEKYPILKKRVETEKEYIERVIMKNNSELESFIDKFYGEGAHDKLSMKMENSYLNIKKAANTAIARYYIFFLLVINSGGNINASPRVLIDGITSFKSFMDVVQGLPLYKGLRCLNIKGKVLLKSFVEFKNNVEIIVNPSIEYTLAGESFLDNVRLLVENDGKTIEEKI